MSERDFREPSTSASSNSSDKRQATASASLRLRASAQVFSILMRAVSVLGWFLGQSAAMAGREKKRSSANVFTFESSHESLRRGKGAKRVLTTGDTEEQGGNLSLLAGEGGGDTVWFDPALYGHLQSEFTH